MLVLSRKKNESILIDGSVRIDVVNVTRATVRVRLLAPRTLQVLAGTPRKESKAREDPAARAAALGVDDRLMTLVNQQVVSLSESISFGVVDADKSRVLLFVDAPLGTSITALEEADTSQRTTGSRQNLLQFMGPAVDRSDDDREGTDVQTDARGPRGAEVAEPGPDLLPFPAPVSRRRRV
jgi:carbon storage regulator CsrA